MFEKDKKLVMCQACRALVDPSEKTCPMCGEASVPERRLSAVSGGHFISLLILTINVILFVLMGIAGVRNGGGIEAFFASPSSALLYDFGGFNTALVSAGEWWRFVTCNFLHIGFMHLLFNSFALIQLGPIVEEFYGSQKFIFIYLVTGIVSAIASYGFSINGAGASGAIFGLMGLLVVFGYRQGGEWGKNLMRQILIWAGMGIVFGFMIRANNVAHIGGFIGGAILGFILKGDAPQTVRTANRWNAAALVSVVVIVVSFVFVAKTYGAGQEKTQKAQQIISLSRLVREADLTLEKVDQAETKEQRLAMVQTIRRTAKDITDLPQIDERSRLIRQQLTEALNRQADNLEKQLDKSSSLAESDNMIFESYYSWEESVLSTYGLTRNP